MTSDERYMQMALCLARRGLGSVEPNPAVGAVIVKGGQIIGRGWHKRFGGPHAEINALVDCRKRGGNPKGATMFVTLEPCCHYGKTGPCTDALIEAKLARVVIATIDPSKHANGRGIRQLRGAGIKVDVGVCEAPARLLSAPFMKFASTGKCWVTLKWAQTIDGKLAWTNTSHESRATSDEQRWISCQESRNDAHELRRQVGAILVGINTVLADDSLLTPRPSHAPTASLLPAAPTRAGRRGGRRSKTAGAIRIVLDNRLRIPLNSRLLATAKDAPVIIVADSRILRTKPKKAKQIVGRGAELLGCPASARSNLVFLLDELSKRGVQHLLVEGGPTVIGSFLKENLADEIVVYITPKILGDKGAADISGGLSDVQLRCVNIKCIGDDIRINGLTKNGAESAGILKGKL
ncbi:MAG: bifunctional diaminohydroxyphosphoribosylaminopyrimidine deaminase/5-amino-6-(5-phosphoribosylamino)uracil reductase RibD [Sedimentisphaerales bacterium]|nr:bifunctional diaminohydroxyphosphoribosylaminopyrimidine deaminase/5-amino-6-(5-phosphoribosylamino)uracil reductase RibD [Sedimentisphaerales bacterium]